jgi:prepilin signal peptidase PulO-like enzyme (type II secretory pathway)
MKILPFLMFIVFSLHSVINDIVYYRVKVLEIIAGTILVIVFQAMLPNSSLLDSILGGVMGYGTFWGIYRLTHGRLGVGDIWFSGFIGTTFGFWGWNWSILLGAFLGIGYISIRKILGSIRDIRNTRIPFTPFMVMGVLLSSLIKGFGS